VVLGVVSLVALSTVEHAEVIRRAAAAAAIPIFFCQAIAIFSFD